MYGAERGVLEFRRSLSARKSIGQIADPDKPDTPPPPPPPPPTSES